MISAVLGTLLAVFLFGQLPEIEPRRTPVAREVPPVVAMKRTIFRRPPSPKPFVPKAEAAPEPEPLPPQGLDALDRETQLATKNAAAVALGAAIERCDAVTPPALAVIAVVTIDPQGLAEMEALDGAGEPLEIPELERCLDGVLWDAEWPTTHAPTRFGLVYSGSVGG